MSFQLFYIAYMQLRALNGIHFIIEVKIVNIKTQNDVHISELIILEILKKKYIK
ncbi:MAG: hypothetical protein ACTSQP_22025 [Promethearchaeota archaeon]